MLPEFRSQLFQLPLIATSWIGIRNRYVQEKQSSSFPTRFILSFIEQIISLVHENIVQPLFNPFYSYLNNLDGFLCRHIDSIQRICPIVNQTLDEIIEYYSDLFNLSYINKTYRSSSSNSNTNHLINNHKEKKFQFFQRYLQFLTKFLMIIEIYSKYIQNEFIDYIDISRNLWKNLNMEDGRSLDEVESFSEKLLVLGRRMTGNYRQFLYLLRYQLKRCRYILFSVLHVPNHFRSTIWRITRKVKINRMNQKLNDRARYGLVTSKERVRHYLEVMMLHAANHPWMRWTAPKVNQSSQVQFERPLKSIRPIFFFSSNNTSDCSEPEDNLRNRTSKIFESTPYRKDHKHSNIIQSKEQIEDVLTNISSSSSSTLEQSFDVKDILRQVGSQSRQRSNTSSSTDQEEQNQVIEQAFNESNDNDQQKQGPVSVFDLSPMLASGCAL